MAKIDLASNGAPDAERLLSEAQTGVPIGLEIALLLKYLTRVLSRSIAGALLLTLKPLIDLSKP
jgi:hypothetical protein